MSIGGVIVIAAIALIFLFLFYSVAPLFQAAKVGAVTQFDVDYAEATAFTTYGATGVKVWIFKGEIMEHDPMAQDKRMAGSPKTLNNKSIDQG